MPKLTALLLACACLCRAEAQAPPNILLFFPDELRYDWGGMHNNPYYTQSELPLRMPHFDAVAMNGTRFTRAFSGSPVCAPSRGCMASGRQYDEVNLPMNFHNDFDARHIPTFYSVLRDVAGYHTMAVGRDDLNKDTLGPGDNGTKNTQLLGFSDAMRCDGSTDVTYSGKPHEPFGWWLKSRPNENATARAHYGANDLFELACARNHELSNMTAYPDVYAISEPTPLPDEAYQDNWIGDQALKLLERRPRDRPFFLQVSHQAPHPPQDITEGMAKGVRGREFATPKMSDSPPERVRIGRQNYAAKTEHLDSLLGRYMSLLGQQGVLAETVICIGSDHGEQLFDRSGLGKSRPWSASTSVPLICSGPGIARNRALDRPVSTVDLAPTFLDMANVLDHAPAGMSNASLLDVLTAKGEAPRRRVVRFGLENFRGVVERINATHVLKFFCCSGVSGYPTLHNDTCPGSTAADSAGFKPGEPEHHLFNIADDRDETPASDLRASHPDLVRHYAAMLPPAHETPRTGPGAQSVGYVWPGCEPLL